MTHLDSNPFLIRRRSLLAAGLAAFALPALGKHADRQTDANSSAFDAFAIAQMRQSKIPGLAVGLARDGVVRVVRGYGYANIEKRRAVTAQTQFHLASITKTVTATAIMQLADEGRLRIDDPVAPHLDFALSSPHHPEAPITFRQLLMHTSSLSDEKYYEVDFRERGRDATQTLGDFLKNYLAPGGNAYSSEKCYSTDAPGSRWHYSNVGYGLLGHLAGRIGNEDMREQTKKRIFAPLGMRNTHWTLRETPANRMATPYDLVEDVLTPVQPVGFPDWPAGMLRSSMADFIRFVAASANRGTALDAHLVEPKTMAQMLDMQTPAGLPDWLTGQGLGWMTSKLNGTPTPNHWGGDPGVFTAVYLEPEKRAGVALFANATATNENKTAMRNIATRLLEGDLHD